MTERKYNPVDPDAVAEQFLEMPEEELAEVRTKLNEVEAKRNLVKTGPDFNKMSSQDARKLIIEQFGFDPGWSG
jgi:sugar-specific transcriptional regulator TrmB